MTSGSLDAVQGSNATGSSSSGLVSPDQAMQNVNDNVTQFNAAVAVLKGFIQKIENELTEVLPTLTASQAYACLPILMCQTSEVAVGYSTVTMDAINVQNSVGSLIDNAYSNFNSAFNQAYTDMNAKPPVALSSDSTLQGYVQNLITDLQNLNTVAASSQGGPGQEPFMSSSEQEQIQQGVSTISNQLGAPSGSPNDLTVTGVTNVMQGWITQMTPVYTPPASGSSGNNNPQGTITGGSVPPGLNTTTSTFTQMLSLPSTENPTALTKLKTSLSYASQLFNMAEQSGKYETTTNTYAINKQQAS